MPRSKSNKEREERYRSQNHKRASKGGRNNRGSRGVSQDEVREHNKRNDLMNKAEIQTTLPIGIIQMKLLWIP